MSRQGTKKVAKKVERPGLSTEEVDEIKQAFDLFDTNGQKSRTAKRAQHSPLACSRTSHSNREEPQSKNIQNENFCK